MSILPHSYHEQYTMSFSLDLSGKDDGTIPETHGHFKWENSQINLLNYKLVSDFCSSSHMCECTINLHAEWAARSPAHRQFSDGAIQISMKTLNKEKSILWCYKAEGQCNWIHRSVRGPISPANGLGKISWVWQLLFLLSQWINVNCSSVTV